MEIYLSYLDGGSIWKALIEEAKDGCFEAFHLELRPVSFHILLLDLENEEPTFRCERAPFD